MNCKYCKNKSQEFDICEPCEQKIALIGWNKDYDKSPKPNHGKNPYSTHVTCKKCDGIWMERTSCNKNKTGRLTCPCCNILVRVTARRKHGGETAKLYEG